MINSNLKTYITVTVTGVMFLFAAGAFFLKGGFLSDKKGRLEISTNVDTIQSSFSFKKEFQDEITTNKVDGTEYKNVVENARKIKSEILNSITDTEGQKLFKKAVYYKAFLSENLNTYTETEVLKTFDEMYVDFISINSLAPKEKNNLNNLKARYIYSFYEIYPIHSSAILQKTQWMRNTEYKIFEQKYLDKSIAFKFYLESIYKSLEDYDDSLIIGERINNLSSILNIHDKQIDVEDKNYVVLQLKNSLGSFDKKSETKLSIFQMEKIFLPLFYEARGWSILSRYEKVDTKFVVGKFKNLYKNIEEKVLSKDDRIYKVKFRADFEYMTYLYIQKGYKIDRDIESIIKVIGKYREDFKDNQFMLSYFKNAVNSINKTSVIYKIIENSPSFQGVIKSFQM